MPTKVGIIGWPLTTTLSPAMHNAAFRALGMDWEYDAMAIPPDIVREGILEPQRHGYVGLNVTIPHKEEAMKYVTPDDVARAVGAVNTIDLRDMTATNTDLLGFLMDLAAHGIDVSGKRVTVLGAGGAARSAVVGLCGAGADVRVASRSLDKARMMVANLALSNIRLSARAVDIADLAAEPTDVIVNCTPAGMLPEVDATPWPDPVPFPEQVIVYDMIYKPARTRLMQQAEAHGGRGVGGLGMLVHQGAAAFERWTGVTAPVDVMFEAVRAQLGLNDVNRSGNDEGARR
ncbi:MAG: shikimate dehydrogenase [Chloroflexi bacterium]|nr:shikimate dehydrogenase [Chloroflexota bacterium]